MRAAPQVIGDLLSHEPGGVGSASTYAALMAACEKAGQWDLALVLFEKMSSQVRMCGVFEDRCPPRCVWCWAHPAWLPARAGSPRPPLV